VHVPVALERMLDEASDVLLVLDDEDARGLAEGLQARGGGVGLGRLDVVHGQGSSVGRRCRLRRHDTATLRTRGFPPVTEALTLGYDGAKIAARRGR
jgi:hypothetical protein